MDEKRFDTMARGLARLASRRRVLGGVLGGTLTLLTGSSAIAIRGKLRRARRGGHGQEETATASDVLPEGVLAGGVWEETIEMCHYDPETGGYRIVPVSTVAVPEQLTRGDTLYIDCCVSTDCASTDCLDGNGLRLRRLQLRRRAQRSVQSRKRRVRHLSQRRRLRSDQLRARLSADDVGVATATPATLPSSMKRGFHAGCYRFTSSSARSWSTRAVSARPARSSPTSSRRSSRRQSDRY